MECRWFLRKACENDRAGCPEQSGTSVPAPQIIQLHYIDYRNPE